MYRTKTSFAGCVIRYCAFALALVCMIPAAWSQMALRDTAITLGEGWALVRELRQVDLVHGEQEMWLDGIPPEADLSTLMIRSRRVAVELLSWERGERGDADVVRCRVLSPVALQRIGVDVIYRITGLSWTAHYEILVRGEGEDEREPVSADFRGVIRLVNPTSKSFSNAVVRVEHRESVGAATPPKGSGFLMLDRSFPLTDIWFDSPSEEPIPYSYQIPGRLHLRAYSETEAPFIGRVRTPAWRFYSMESEDFPIDARDPLPLTKMIAFRHEDEEREAVSMLPPGNVRVYVGGLRRHFVQDAQFRRVSPGEEIRVDLGPSEDVWGRRLAGARRLLPGKVMSESYGIHLRNTRAADVQVEINEKPPAGLGWSLIRSTLPCRPHAQRLLFSTWLGAGAVTEIEYQLRVSEPEI